MRLNSTSSGVSQRGYFARRRWTYVWKLEKVEAMITDVALQTGRAQGAAPDRRPKCPRELRQLERDASQAISCPEERRRLRSEARKMRRRWQADIASWKLTTRQQSKSVPLRMMDMEGNMSADPRKWSETLLKHCEGKYSRPDHLAAPV